GGQEEGDQDGGPQGPRPRRGAGQRARRAPAHRAARLAAEREGGRDPEGPRGRDRPRAGEADPREDGGHLTMPCKVLILAEHEGGAVAGITYELLGMAHRVGGETGGAPAEVKAPLIGS